MLIKRRKTLLERDKALYNGLLYSRIFLIKRNGVISGEKIKARPADKDLSSWTGLSRSGHVQILTVHPNCHVSDPKYAFSATFQYDSACFSWRNKNHSKITPNPTWYIK